MINIEKLIKSWEIFRDSNPYQICDGKEFRAIKEPEYCMGQMVEDTIVLLKGQEAKTQDADSGMCEICSFYERALPVKPHYNSRTNWYECGACHYSMTSGMICRSELIPACKVGFCAKCGKAVKWE